MDNILLLLFIAIIVLVVVSAINEWARAVIKAMCDDE